MYDHSRSDNYNFKSCKHLACSEIRAARLHPFCKTMNKGKLMINKMNFQKYANQANEDSEACIKQKASEYLAERSFCRVKT